MLKILLYIICEAPPKNFNYILAIFSLFHLTIWLYLQKPEIRNLGETRF